MRIGLLGAARISDKALVHPAHVIPQTRLSCIAARDRARAEDKARDWGVERVLQSYEEVIGDPDTDLIYNPLPINLHAEWTIKALQAGKHVLCEKPFTMNLDEAEAVLSVARSTGKRVIEAFHYRYHPAFQACLTAIEQGAIGKVEHIEAQFNVAIPYNPDEIRHRRDTGGGAMMDLGCYPLNWALMVAGASTVEKVTAQAEMTQGGVDESMQADLVFSTGVTARLRASMADGTPFRARLVVRGSAGDVAFENPIAPHLGARLTVTSNGSGKAYPISPISTYTWQLAAVVAGLKSGEALPTEGEAILRQQSALDAIYKAAGLGGLRATS